MSENRSKTAKNSKTLWQRQAAAPLWETARQFELFQYFLSLQPVERTSENVRKHFGFTNKRGVEKVRSDKQWNRRAQAFDDNRAKHVETKMNEKAAEVAFDWAAWEGENLENVKNIADQLFKKTKEILSLPVTETTKKNPIIDQNGQIVFQEITLKPLRFSASDAPRFAEAAVLLSRFVIEQTEASKRAKQNVNLHLPKPKKAWDQMSPEDIEAYIEECNLARTAIEKGEGVEDFSEGRAQ